MVHIYIGREGYIALAWRATLRVEKERERESVLVCFRARTVGITIMESDEEVKGKGKVDCVTRNLCALRVDKA